jgi:sigma-B regulation protein RsbU (phosphoserine phosphatase)
MTVGVVYPDTPAEQAGLRAGDRIVAVNRQELQTLRAFYEFVIIGQDDIVELSVQDARSSSGVRQVKLVLRGGQPAPMRMTRLEHILDLPMNYFPFGFLIVGVALLLLRPDDRNAWLLALLCGGFVAGGPLFEGAIPVHLRGFAVAYKLIMAWLCAALYYYFFAVFPAPSPLDRKIPWLKNVFVAAVLVATVPMSLRCLIGGGALPLYLHTQWPGWATLTWALTGQAGLPVPASHGWPSSVFIFFGVFLSGTALGLASLISNNFQAADAQIRRKAHVMLWGTVISVTPTVLVLATTVIGGLGVVPVAVWQTCILLLSFLFPLSFAYAVVKHRVLEIPVLLKRSARYLVVKQGFLLLTMFVTITVIWLFVNTYTRLIRVSNESALPFGILGGVVLGIIAARVNLYMRRTVTQKLDRAFFRSAYDAQQVLESLANKSRKATDRHQLTALLQSEIIQALHPTSVGVYLKANGGGLNLQREGPDSGLSPILDPDLPLFRDLARRAEPSELSAEQVGTDVGSVVFGCMQPECLVPLLGGDGQLTGIVALGSRLSEEPYSREDKRLLASVASQAGLALDSIRLGEEVAERIESERRAARDMEIAKQVQGRLFPQKLPQLLTLDYAGRCTQARQVGGDYYDFLNLGAGRVGIVLADIVGKGIPGALLMANLQADVRSQCAIAPQDLPQFLKSVNQAFYESTDEGSYATLFFGDYQDSTRRLRFANCGHNPPFLVRPSGTAERLAGTATVLGLFERWDASICEVQIARGDVLVIYTDGITEANNSFGEEFGENRLLETIRAHLTLPVSSMLDAIISETLEFSGGESGMKDDLTLIVARGR